MSKFAGTMFERRNWKRVYQVAGLMREKISNCESKLILVALTVAGCLMTAGVVLALALQLLFLKASESMGNHDSEVVGACSVD
jgi:hypothetical protein